jgi:hypothetical protein
MIRTEASCTCSLEHSFGILSRFLAFLALNVLLEFLLISYCPGLLWLNASVLLNGIKIGEIVQIIDFKVIQCDSKIFTNKAGNVFVLD